MRYFTTMNLPSPGIEIFNKNLKRYDSKPKDAITEFNRGLEEFFEVPRVFTFNSCFAGLGLLLNFACKNTGKYVAMAACGYRRSVDIVHWAGLQPLLIDNNQKTLGLDQENLVSRIKEVGVENVGCILVQHPMVKLLEPYRYEEIGTKLGIPVVFDSVEATGSNIGGVKVGGFGLAEVFSLHPSKVLNAGEGGVISFKSINSAQEFQEYWTKRGVFKELYNHEEHSFMIEPINAILGVSSLEKYREFINGFKAQYSCYQAEIKEMSHTEVSLIQYDQKNDPNYKTILIKLSDRLARYRPNILEHLEKQSIGARPYYFPLPKSAQKTNSYINAQKISNSHLILPIGHSVGIGDIKIIVQHFMKAIEGTNYV